MRTLEQKIEQRDTELHRYYDMAVKEKADSEARIKQLRSEIEDLEDKILQCKGLMAKCVRRAEEQGKDESIFK